MTAHLYQKIILKNPRSILIILLIALISFGYYSKDFRLDASSETLLIEGDPDLKYLKEVTNRYGSKDFLVLTHTPNDGMISDSAINNLLSLKYKLQSLDWVHSVITLLDIPLLDNSDAPLQERLMNFKTLKDEGVDKERGFREILASPVFRNFVISEDGKTSGIIVNIKENATKCSMTGEQIAEQQGNTAVLLLRLQDLVSEMMRGNADIAALGATDDCTDELGVAPRPALVSRTPIRVGASSVRWTSSARSRRA